ncbi:MAG: hypothetical protein ABR915_15125, partial [Thermoguttaceae bacterium]
RSLAADLKRSGVDVEPALGELNRVEGEWKALPAKPDAEAVDRLHARARAAVRKLALANPLLDFDDILFAKTAPGLFCHMCDQYYGWWSRPGGGICVLANWKSDRPRVRCLTEGKFEPGSFLRPDLSYDARRVLFAYCKHYPHIAGLSNKLDKKNVPEDAFYHVFEMNVDGTGVRQLTRGKYDDFDARYLPDGRIVFLSTRRGQFIQCGSESALATLARGDLPDIYVRCGGDAGRPVPVYTLHTMDAGGKDLRAISAFEMFEWTPAVANDGRILYSRWDYVDRHNIPFMKLWSTNPDGTSARIVWGNFVTKPHCAFEARPVPGSSKIVFVGSAHHSISGGPLVLLDPQAGTDGTAPIVKLTPEVPYPECEGWPKTYYVSPYPLSERYYLTGWSPAPLQAGDGSGGWGARPNPPNATGLYLYDVFGNLELIYRDPEISSNCPIPLRPRPLPPLYAGLSDDGTANEGKILVEDVYQGLVGIERGAVKRLRIVAVPPKTQPWMNNPRLGPLGDQPGKCVLGTVPVEADGSAYFRAPAGVTVFFQALAADGAAIQTMRSGAYVQPGQTLSCIGCHERRESSPGVSRPPQAALRQPSRLAPGPEGSWPLRFDRLVQPVLDKHCVECHSPAAADPAGAKVNLTADKAYDTLIAYRGKGRSLREAVQAAYNLSRSIPGRGEAATSGLLMLLRDPQGHRGVRLDADALERLLTWMDTYAQRQGSFSPEQEQELLRLRRQWAALLEDPSLPR